MTITNSVSNNPSETLLVHTRAELDAARAGRVGEVAVVMTMGALHEGHLALVHAARRRAKTVIVTVFVNPLQFGPNEDFARYPRTLEQDLKMCEQAEVDIVFAPSVDEVYPGGDSEGADHAGTDGRGAGGRDPARALLRHAHDRQQADQYDRARLRPLRREGRAAARPDPPDGARPEPAGRDRRGAHGARAGRPGPLQPQPLPVRRGGGSARSASAGPCSRAFSSARRRRSAPPRRAILDGAARAEPPVELDYLALVNPADFTEVDDAYRGPAVLAVAAKVGSTRLIDNLPLEIEG
jgi:pantoate--beta-alanine ligase